MARTIRSESAANLVLADNAINSQARRMAQESERVEWRRVLDRREARQVKEWANHHALARQQRNRQTGAVVFGMLASLASFALVVLSHVRG